MEHVLRKLSKCGTTMLLEHPKLARFSHCLYDRKIPAHTIAAVEEVAFAHSIFSPELSTSLTFLHPIPC